jgi:hypothetical protein
MAAIGGAAAGATAKVRPPAGDSACESGAANAVGTTPIIVALGDGACGGACGADGRVDARSEIGCAGSACAIASSNRKPHRPQKRAGPSTELAHCGQAFDGSEDIVSLITPPTPEVQFGYLRCTCRLIDVRSPGPSLALLKCTYLS